MNREQPCLPQYKQTQASGSRRSSTAHQACDDETQRRDKGQAAGDHPSSPSARPSSPATQVTPAAAWARYTNARWGYSLNYPQQWYNLANNGAPDTDKYFSSENIGAPLEMTKAGIWLTVRVTSGACTSVAGHIDGQATLIVAGSPVTRTYGLLSPAAGEPAWVIDAAIAHSSRCVAFHYLAHTQAARDSSLAIADGMITSLSFS